MVRFNRFTFFFVFVFILVFVFVFKHLSGVSDNKFIKNDLLNKENSVCNVKIGLNKQFCDFFNKTGDYTDEKVSEKMIPMLNREIPKLGIVSSDYKLECWLFDYQKRDEYILLVVGFDSIDGDRFITTLAIPIYIYNDIDQRYTLSFAEMLDSGLAGGVKKESISEVKTMEDICDNLDELKNSPIIISLLGLKEFTGSLDGLNDSGVRFVNEKNDRVALVNKLHSSLLNNGFDQGSNILNENSFVKITEIDDIDSINVVSVPIIRNSIRY